MAKSYITLQLYSRGGGGGGPLFFSEKLKEHQNVVLVAMAKINLFSYNTPFPKQQINWQVIQWSYNWQVPHFSCLDAWKGF